MRALVLIIMLLSGTATVLSAQEKGSGLEISHLAGNYYVFTTYQMLEDGLFPANGMYAVTHDGAVIIDAPWDTTQTEKLLNYIDQEHHQKVVLAIATHSHRDRTGSFDVLARHGIRTYASTKTLEQCRILGSPKPRYTFTNDTLFKVGGVSVQTYYPGEGHTTDNIVVWFKDAQILFGGCFVKSTEAADLGYTDEANIKAWPASVGRVIKRYPGARFIIPGHQDWHSKRSLTHTLDLLKKHPGK